MASACVEEGVCLSRRGRSKPIDLVLCLHFASCRVECPVSDRRGHGPRPIYTLVSSQCHRSGSCLYGNRLQLALRASRLPLASRLCHISVSDRSPCAFVPSGSPDGSDGRAMSLSPFVPPPPAGCCRAYDAASWRVAPLACLSQPPASDLLEWRAARLPI
jgi:hypothetical protein